MLHDAFVTEMEKIAGPFSPYERMRRSAKKDRTLSPGERENMQRQYMEARGKDKSRGARVGGAAGGAAGALATLGSFANDADIHHHSVRMGIPSRPPSKGKAAAMGAAAALGVGGITGAISEVRRRQAAAGSKNPARVKAELAGANSPRRVNQRSRLIRNRNAAVRGEKPSSAMFRRRAAGRGSEKL